MPKAILFADKNPMFSTNKFRIIASAIFLAILLFNLSALFSQKKKIKNQSTKTKKSTEYHQNNADSPLSQYTQARNFIKSKKYQEAISIYSDLIKKQNFTNSHIFADLSYCYFKIENLALAKYWLLKAQLTKPSIKNIKQNLSLIENQLNSYSFKKSKLTIFLYKINKKSLLLFTNLILWLLIIAFLLYLSKNKKYKTLLKLQILLALLLCLSAFFLLQKHTADKALKKTFIITSADSSEIYSAPSSVTEIVSFIPSGSEGIAIDLITNPKWLLAKFPNNTIGWLPTNKIKFLE